MKVERNWKRVMKEMKRRGLPTCSAGNCNTFASEKTRELFYFQWKPKMAMWARYEPHEMDRFRAFLQDQERRAQTQDSRPHGQPINVGDMPLGDLLKAWESGTIRPGPIRHPTLPPELLKEIQRLWYSVGKAAYGGNGTLEEWELGFMRDVHPEREILVWRRIESATERYLMDHPDSNREETAHQMNLCSIGNGNPNYRPYWDQAGGGGAKDGQHRHGAK